MAATGGWTLAKVDEYPTALEATTKDGIQILVRANVKVRSGAQRPDRHAGRGGRHRRLHRCARNPRHHRHAQEHPVRVHLRRLIAVRDLRSPDGLCSAFDSG
jgi:hypothetical protein